MTVTDMHRPYIDELTRPNPDDPTGRSTMRRVPEVLDCWFESGSMPFAQVHYPFENHDWFEHHYPGDFIVEYIGQTRGWFYTMHVLATALFDRPAFRNCLSHGILQGADGRKMSKSLQNYPDVYEVFNSHGSDAMRWMLMSSPVLRGGDMPVTEPAIRDAVRQVLLPLWNVWYFFSLYANASGHEAATRTDSTHLLDRYILAKTGELVTTVQEQMDAYDISGACASVRSYLDALTNWYVRRSRDRFWSGDADAFDTLATVLETLCRVVAPLAPLTAEEIWRGLTGERSVHLTDWPSAAPFPADHELVASMDAIREVASAALAGHEAVIRTDSEHLLDRYILAKTGELVSTVQDQMDEYDISGACASVRSYLDALTNWYVRRSRDRFWSGDVDAFDTLATVLETLCRVVAPFAPLTAEEIWRGLTGGRSVHLTDWPSADTFGKNHELVASMDAIRDVASAALSLRKAKGLRVRLPLASLTVATPQAEALRPFVDLLADEVNVKAVVFSDDLAAYCQQVLTVVPRVLGPRVGGSVQQVIKAVKTGDWSLVDGAPVAAGVTLQEGEYELKLVAADVEHSAPLPTGGGVVVLDTEVTPELAAEGLARDVVRVVQQARRDADLDVSDRITLSRVGVAGGRRGGDHAPGVRGR